MTYPLTNKSAINKHIPPTAPPPLVSLSWLGPGHTFKTTYAPAADGTSDVSQHIVAIDSKMRRPDYYPTLLDEALVSCF